MPGTPGQTVEAAERIAAAVRAHRFALGDGRAIPVSVSIGIAAAPGHAETYPGVLAAAERALQKAERAGGARVVVALEPAEEPPHEPLEIDQFIGRADQLRTLLRALGDALQSRSQVTVVHGESGIGCTTLVAQLEPEVAVRGGAWVRGAARRLAVRPPYGAWAEIIAALSRLPNAPTGPWHELPHLVPELANSAMPEAPGGSQFRLFEELSAYVLAAAAERPLVLVLDDMQWADEATWDALEYLLPKLQDAPVLTVVVLRNDQRDPAVQERRERLARRDGAHDVTLSRLTRDEAKRLVEAAFHRQDVGREFLSFIYRQTEGNPLYIGQLLRALVEAGAIWHSGERWEWRPVSELQVPGGLDALVMRRLGEFGARAQLALATAAVLGRAFDAALLAEATGGSLADAETIVAQGVAAGLLAEARGSAGAGHVLAHDRLGEIVLSHLAPQRLRRAHERVARALEQAPGGSPTEAVEIAVHYDAAGVTAGAYAAALRATDHAERLFANATATELLRLAARNAGTPGELAASRSRLAVLAEIAGHYDEAEELCDLAIEWYAGQGDHARAIALRRIRERVRSQLGQPARRTLDALRALDQEAAQHGLDGERVAILTLVSQTYGRLGDRQSAARIAAECVETAERIGDPELLADSLNRYAISIEIDHPERAKELYARALELYEARGDTRGQVRIHGNFSLVAEMLGDLEEATRELSLAISLARTAGLIDQWGMSAHNLGVLMMKLGRYERARELLSEALSLFATLKNSELQLYALYNLAHLEREQGEYYSAAELYDVALSLAQRIGQLDVEAGALGGAGLCMLRLGRHDEAVEALRNVEARVGERTEWFMGRELIEALSIAVAVHQGRVGEAVARFEQVASRTDTDTYSAAWLTAECGSILAPHAGQVVRERIAEYRGSVESLGYAEIRRRYAELGAEAAS